MAGRVETFSIQEASGLLQYRDANWVRNGATLTRRVDPTWNQIGGDDGVWVWHVGQPVLVCVYVRQRVAAGGDDGRGADARERCELQRGGGDDGVYAGRWERDAGQ